MFIGGVEMNIFGTLKPAMMRAGFVTVQCSSYITPLHKNISNDRNELIQTTDSTVLLGIE